MLSGMVSLSELVRNAQCSTVMMLPKHIRWNTKCTSTCHFPIQIKRIVSQLPYLILKPLLLLHNKSLLRVGQKSLFCSTIRRYCMLKSLLKFFVFDYYFNFFMKFEKKNQKNDFSIVSNVFIVILRFRKKVSILNSFRRTLNKFRPVFNTIHFSYEFDYEYPVNGGIRDYGDLDLPSNWSLQHHIPFTIHMGSINSLFATMIDPWGRMNDFAIRIEEMISQQKNPSQIRQISEGVIISSNMKSLIKWSY